MTTQPLEGITSDDVNEDLVQLMKSSVPAGNHDTERRCQDEQNIEPNNETEDVARPFLEHAHTDDDSSAEQMVTTVIANRPSRDDEPSQDDNIPFQGYDSLHQSGLELPAPSWRTKRRRQQSLTALATDLKQRLHQAWFDLSERLLQECCSESASESNPDGTTTVDDDLLVVLPLPALRWILIQSLQETQRQIGGHDGAGWNALVIPTQSAHPWERLKRQKGLHRIMRLRITQQQPPSLSWPSCNSHRDQSVPPFEDESRAAEWLGAYLRWQRHFEMHVGVPRHLREVFPAVSQLELHRLPVEAFKGGVLAALAPQLQRLNVSETMFADTSEIFNIFQATATTQPLSERRAKTSIPHGPQNALNLTTAPEVQSSQSPPQAFSRFLKMTHLEIENCGLTSTFIRDPRGRIRPLWHLFPSLEFLSLRRNRLSQQGHACTGLSMLFHLQTLDLSHNQLRHLTQIHCHLGNVVHLDLSHNRILTCTPGLDKLFSLRTLKLHHNDITELADVRGLARLPLLQHLELARNPLVAKTTLSSRGTPRNPKRRVGSSTAPVATIESDSNNTAWSFTSSISRMKKSQLVQLASEKWSTRSSAPIRQAVRLAILDLFWQTRHRWDDLPMLDHMPLQLHEKQVFERKQNAIQTLEVATARSVIPISIPSPEQATPFPKTQLVFTHTRKASSRRKRNLVSITTQAAQDDYRQKLLSSTELVAVPESSIVESPSDSVCVDSKEPKSSLGTCSFTTYDVLESLAQKVARESIVVETGSDTANDETNMNVDESLAEDDETLGEIQDSWKGKTRLVPPNNLVEISDGSINNAADKEAKVPIRTAIQKQTSFSAESSISMLDSISAEGESRNMVVDSEGVPMQSESSAVANTVSLQCESSLVANAVPLQSESSVVADSSPSKLRTRPLSSPPRRIITIPLSSSVHTTSTGTDDGILVQSLFMVTNTQTDNASQDDNISFTSSIATPQVDDRKKFILAEKNSTFLGPHTYKQLTIVDHLDLYFRLFVFSDAVNHADSNPLLDSLENSWQHVLETYPRIQLWPADRQVQEAEFHNRPQRVHEEFRAVWRESVVACGKPALKRLTPTRTTRLGFHGEMIWPVTAASAETSPARQPESVTRDRRAIFCCSDRAFYIISDHDPMQMKSVPSKRNQVFPVPVALDACFAEAKWPHALVRHPWNSLKAITIGFKFQRLTLRFSTADSEDFCYILLTSNKLKTVRLLRELQNLAEGHLEPTFGGAISSPSAKSRLLIDNDDFKVLDALSTALGDIDGTVTHYQILRQYWRRGDRGLVRRVCFVTDCKLYLLDEDFSGDGSKDIESISEGHDWTDPEYRLVDTADLGQIEVVQAAPDNPCAITISIRPTSRLQRTHNWRLLCRDREEAEVLVEEVRKVLIMFTSSM